MLSAVEYTILGAVYVALVIAVNYLQSDKMTDIFWNAVTKRIELK